MNRTMLLGYLAMDMALRGHKDHYNTLERFGFSEDWIRANVNLAKSIIKNKFKKIRVGPNSIEGMNAYLDEHFPQYLGNIDHYKHARYEWEQSHYGHQRSRFI